jgi:hypothetical protein
MQFAAARAALAECHAITREVSAIFKLRVLETPQARVDILPCALERGREHRRVASGFRCSTGGMGPDYERSVPKKADPLEDGARHDHIDDRLHKRIRRCCHEFGELRMNLVPGAIDKRPHGRLWPGDRFKAQLRHAPREASSRIARSIGKADGVQPGQFHTAQIGQGGRRKPT